MGNTALGSSGTERDRTCSWSTVIAILAGLVLAGCVSRTPYPSDWPDVVPAPEACQTFAGSFSNYSSSSTETASDPVPMTLSEVFFGGLLSGFEVTHLLFEPLPGGTIRVVPWVGETRLREEAVLTPRSGKCSSEHWIVDTGWKVDAGMITGGLVWTGGLLVPAAFKGRFVIVRTTTSQLAIRTSAYALGTTLIVFPFRARMVDDWFLFEPAAFTADSHEVP